MKIKNIGLVAEHLGLKKDECEFYGDYKAKVNFKVLERLKNKNSGKLIFVTSINPTPLGEGKTTTSIGLLQALGVLKKRAILCLREPSLGPVFGIKGGAAGGGKARLYPFEDINLHFTGDSHAVSIAHNLLSAVIDNHIYRGNKLNIDVNRILWGRVIDICDRTLRKVDIGINIKKQFYPRRSWFTITAASEIMAILALFRNYNDLNKMLKRIIVASDKNGKPIYARHFKIIPSLLLVLKDALHPNLVQSIEGNPVFIHTGPFANVAHGNNSLIATKIALKLADYVITEGGFGSELGLEKFIHIVARKAGFKISTVVIVVSLRALKYHGGIDLKNSCRMNLNALEKGCANLKHHVGIVKKFGLEAIVCINRFPEDTYREINFLKRYCERIVKVDVAVSDVYNKGGRGGLELAEKVLSRVHSSNPRTKFIYSLRDNLRVKIGNIAREIYGASGVRYSKIAEEKINRYQIQGFGKLPLNMAKTQFSLTHNSKVRGLPDNWELEISDILLSNGAGFVIPVCGPMILLPGLPLHPIAERIKIKKDKFQGFY